jgi:hypothetical protein
VCPVCNIIVREQADLFQSMLERKFLNIIEKHQKAWEYNGLFSIANIEPGLLATCLAFNSMDWIQPRYHNIPDLSPEEVRDHPLSGQKKVRK